MTTENNYATTPLDPASAIASTATATAPVLVKAADIAPSAAMAEPLAFESLSEERKNQVNAIVAKTDMNTDVAITFGKVAQERIQSFSASALESVRSVDLGPMGDKVAELVGDITEFNASAQKKKGFLFRAKKHLAKVTAQYDSLEKNVSKITKELQGHQVTLLSDVKKFDQLYTLNEQYFKDLTTIIIAGRKKLELERSTTLVQLREKAQQTGLPEDAQAASDFAALCDQFEKKVYDLELTRMVSLQMAPQIRMVQNNDVVMAQKIQSTIVNTIPLWQSQMLITLGLEHTRRAMEAEKAVTDLTNQMLIHNAEQLHLGSVEVAKAAERGVIDIETLTKVNEELIATLDEVSQIHAEGSQHRKDAEAELARLENELGQKMLEASQPRQNG